VNGVVSKRAVLLSVLMADCPKWREIQEIPEDIRSSCGGFWMAVMRGLRDGLSAPKALSAAREERVKGGFVDDQTVVMEFVRKYFTPAYERAEKIVAACEAFDVEAAEELERIAARG